MGYKFITEPFDSGRPNMGRKLTEDGFTVSWWHDWWSKPAAIAEIWGPGRGLLEEAHKECGKWSRYSCSHTPCVEENVRIAALLLELTQEIDARWQECRASAENDSE